MNKLILLTFAMLTAASMQAQTISLVKDLSPGSADPRAFTVHNGELYFFANDHRNGVQIWHTDGVHDPQMVSNSVLDLNPYLQMASFNGKLYFPGEAGGTGMELCEYDGVRPPKLIADIKPGVYHSTPRDFAVAYGKLFFAALSPDKGVELYSLDSNGTLQLYDIFPGAASSNPSNLTVYNEELYFNPSDCSLTGLWHFDNTTGTASQVSGVRIDGRSCAVVTGGRMYFRGSVGGDSVALVSYDGRSVQHTSTALNGITVLRQAPLAPWGNDVIFCGVTGAASSGLFRYSAATDQVSLITPLFFPAQSGGEVGYEMIDAEVFDNALYISMRRDSAQGYELYRYDGSSLSLVADLRSGPASSSPDGLTILNGQLFMSADDGRKGTELYRVTKNLGLQAARWAGATVSLHPNPAAGNATLSVGLPAAQDLRISVRDMTGRIVVCIDPRRYDAGRHEIALPMAPLPAGQYVYSIQDSRSALLASGSVVKQ